MLEALILSRSAAAWAAGRRGDALRLLKDAVRADRTRAGARLALAERYREMGNPDQAGRWGIAIEGWATDLERDRLARLLASSWVRNQDVPEFLALPPGELPAPVVELLAGPVERYRERFDLQARERPESLPSGSAVMEWFWGIFVAALVIIPILTVGLAFFGVADVGTVRWLVFALVALLGLALIATALVLYRQGASAVGMRCAGAGIAVLGLVLLYHLVV